MKHVGIAVLGAFWFVWLLVIIPIPACGEDHYQLGKTCWNQGLYKEAYTHLMEYRKEPYGRSAHVDYMLGTSGCRLENLRGWGCEVLEWMLHRYALTAEARTLIQQELAACQAPWPTTTNVSPASLKAIASMIGASAHASGKMYYWLGKGEAFNAYPAYRVKEIPKQEMQARIFPLSSRDRAIIETRTRVPGFKVEAFDRFVMASHSGHSVETLKKMAVHLEQYLAFLERDFGITLPATYVTVYMVPTSQELMKIAERLHGLRVSYSTLGYSFLDDMSVLVVVPNEFTVGTIKHELFHLAVRSYFGDIPPWLDEGMAGLYEVSQFEGKKVRGLPNWRGKVLNELMKKKPGIRPTIAQLVESSWFAFEQYEDAKVLRKETIEESPSAEQMAAMLATARYFALYLQDIGKLRSIYKELQELTPGGRSVGPVVESIAIIETQLNRRIDRIDSDFLAWFKQVERVH